jgi:hypothetical protein
MPSPGGAAPKPVMPPAPVLPGAKPAFAAVPPPPAPILPGAKPAVPAAPVPPTTPAAATAVVTPPAPLKPAAAIPSAPQDINNKTGTSVVKSAPPKETSRITVKPNLPAKPAVPGNFAGGKPVAAAAAVGAAAAGIAGAAIAKPASKPATTIVKSGTAKINVSPAPKAAVAGTPVAKAATPAATAAPAVVPVPAMTYQEEGSTVLTTSLAGGLAFVTWVTAAVLALDYFGVIGG